jgi:hypothetical protein
MASLVIMKSNNTKKTTATNFGCEFCGRTFLRESTVFNHICETKRRWQDKDKHGNRIGFQSWLQFYTKNTATKKKRDYMDFVKSSYYLAFVKFGIYCSEVNVINVSRYIDWLLNNKIKIDIWTSDTNYTKFLVSYLREEDSMDAVARSIETMIDLASIDKIPAKDVLRYGNRNKICYAITTGKISPWVLYHSDSGKKFLDELDATQIKMILDYINPELWAIKFKRSAETVQQVKGLLNEAGY